MADRMVVLHTQLPVEMKKAFGPFRLIFALLPVLGMVPIIHVPIQGALARIMEVAGVKTEPQGTLPGARHARMGSLETFSVPLMID